MTEGESISDNIKSGSDPIGQTPGIDYILVRILKDLKTFLGVDGRTYTLKAEDVVTLPSLNADILIKRDAAKEIKIGTNTHQDNPQAETLHQAQSQAQNRDNKEQNQSIDKKKIKKQIEDKVVNDMDIDDFISSRNQRRDLAQKLFTQLPDKIPGENNDIKTSLDKDLIENASNDAEYWNLFLTNIEYELDPRIFYKIFISRTVDCMTDNETYILSIIEKYRTSKFWEGLSDKIKIEFISNTLEGIETQNEQRNKDQKESNKDLKESSSNSNKKRKKHSEKNNDKKLELESVEGRGIVYRKITEDFLDIFPPVITFTDNEEILKYNDGIYTTLENSVINEIKNFITDVIAFEKYNLYLSPNHENNIISKIKSKTGVRRSEVDNDPFKLALKNGILDVRTGMLTSFKPDIYLTSNINIEYNPKIHPVPEFIDYLNTTFRGVEWQIPVIQEILGYCLYRAYPYEYLIFFTGGGRNGKGLFFNLLEHLVGKSNFSAISLDEIVRKHSEFTLSDLYGKMVNICGEIGKTKINETRDIKLLTGRDTIQARNLYQKSFKFKNFAKMIFSMNEPPEIEDFTSAMKNRIKIYDFPNEFITGENAIANLEERLTTPEALTGMLNWALEGLHRLLANQGKLSDPRSAAQMGIIYEKKSRPMYYFVRDCIEEDIVGKVLRERLEEAYLKYAKRENLPILSKEKIRERLEEECKTVGIKVELKQIYKNQLNESDRNNKKIAARPRVYLGIKIVNINDESEQDNGLNESNQEFSVESEELYLDRLNMREKCEYFLRNYPQYNVGTVTAEAATIEMVRKFPQLGLMNGMDYINQTMELCKKRCRV